MIEKLPNDPIKVQGVDWEDYVAGEIIAQHNKINEIIDCLNDQHEHKFELTDGSFGALVACSCGQIRYAEEHQDNEPPCEICGDIGHTEIACERRK